ncbi:MAG: mono/diheme cytochrome c family protein [Verrucomicrobiales bacterium]
MFLYSGTLSRFFISLFLSCSHRFPAIACLLVPTVLIADDVTDGEKLFALKLKPLFAEKCLACHGDAPEKLKGKFDMRTREAMLLGGDTFAEEVLMPGKGEASFLYILATRQEEDYEMPPKEAERLTEEQTWWIRDWINEGAPWPEDSRVESIQKKYAEGEQVATSEALSDDWQNRRYAPEKLWAYRPVQVVSIPEGTHPVNHFIEKKLAESPIEAAPSAEARELARRMSFGLTGLPPKFKVVSEFVKAHAMDPQSAVTKFATELMASPHYGERFAGHWLDVARYADSAGFANDYARPNAWRYRDYVVRAFNEDKPYPDFVREQIAGDELDANDPENLVATGFLRMGPWEQTAMSVFKETRQLWLDDVTDSVGQVFLGHALQCAKCHDHKFDPVPTRDYYSMMAVFSTTQFAGRSAPFLDSESQDNFAESDTWVKEKISFYEEQRRELNDRVEKSKVEETGDAKIGENGLDPGDEASLGRMGKNMERHGLEFDRTKPVAFSVYTGNTVVRKWVKGPITVPEKPWGEGSLEEDAILTGGNAYAPSDPVKPRGLSAAESLGEMSGTVFPDGQGKRRLALSEWIVDRKNPLTARVMVNRVWSWHFGRGIAGNPNNVGGTGLLPTHPELLDYLADWFMKHDWSVKQLNHLIISSAAYQRSSRHPDPESLMAHDPTSTLYAHFRPRRLSAEELRDAILVSSGEMNDAIGGIPARPDINLEVAMQPRQIMGGTASVYEPDPLPHQRNRRSLYAEKVRGVRDPFLETFNQPGSDNSCEARENSTVAPQALTLINSEEVHDRARAFAVRLLNEKRSGDATITRAFEIALGRVPTMDEKEACLTEWKSGRAEEEGLKYAAKTYPDGIKRTVMAEKTGEPYDFWEHMPAYSQYVPDVQRSDIDGRTRGLSQVCLVLFNLNEFAYLD